MVSGYFLSRSGKAAILAFIGQVMGTFKKSTNSSCDLTKPIFECVHFLIRGGEAVVLSFCTMGLALQSA